MSAPREGGQEIDGHVLVPFLSDEAVTDFDQAYRPMVRQPPLPLEKPSEGSRPTRPRSEQ